MLPKHFEFIVEIKLKRDLCSVKSVRHLVKKFEETGCTWDTLRSEPPRVPVEVVAEVQKTITTGPLHTARNVSRYLEVPKTTVLNSADVSLSIPAPPGVGTWRQPTACRLCEFFPDQI